MAVIEMAKKGRNIPNDTIYTDTNRQQTQYNAIHKCKTVCCLTLNNSFLFVSYDNCRLSRVET